MSKSVLADSAVMNSIHTEKNDTNCEVQASEFLSLLDLGASIKPLGPPWSWPQPANKVKAKAAICRSKRKAKTQAVLINFLAN